MGIEALVDRDIPGRVSLEKLNHITLQVPYDDLRLEVAMGLSSRVSLICTLGALLELVTQRNGRVLNSRHGVPVGLILPLIQMLLT